MRYALFCIIIIFFCLESLKALSIVKNYNRTIIHDHGKNVTINETLNKKIVQSIVLNSISVCRLAVKSIASSLSIIKLVIGLPIILVLNSIGTISNMFGNMAFYISSYIYDATYEVNEYQLPFIDRIKIFFSNKIRKIAGKFYFYGDRFYLKSENILNIMSKYSLYIDYFYDCFNQLFIYIEKYVDKSKYDITMFDNTNHINSTNVTEVINDLKNNSHNNNSYDFHSIIVPKYPKINSLIHNSNHNLINNNDNNNNNNNNRSLFKIITSYITYIPNDVLGISTTENTNDNTMTSPLGPYLFISFVILVIVSNITIKSKLKKIIVTLTTILLLWYCIFQMDRTFRKKLYTLCVINSMNSFYKTKSNENLKHSSNNLWINNYLEGIWNINKDSHIGGFGPYISKIMEEVLIIEMQKVPSNIAQLYIDKFSLGTHPPVIRSIEIQLPNKLSSNSNNYNMSTIDIFEFIKNRNKTNIMHNNTNENIHNYDFINVMNNIVIDIDIAYVSKDMDIIFDIKSNIDITPALIQISKVKVKELAISSKVRINSELIPNYPFFGNATISFLEIPNINIEITSFGGVDISAFPGVYSLVDITIKWLLRQYTFPLYRNMNIQEIFYYNNTCQDDDNNSKYSSNKYNIISIFHKIILVIFSNNDSIKINTFDDFI